MNAIEIKRATLNELEELQKVARMTFWETFAAVNSAENMRKYLEERFSAQRLSMELMNRDSEFYLAMVGDRAVGYLKLNFGQAQTEPQDEKAVEIERIYVIREFHGGQVGQRLFEQAMRIATEKRTSYVWLGVWENNLRAISFYRKNGFAAFDTHIFRLGDDVQTDLLMKIVLNADKKKDRKADSADRSGLK
ncbi:MAG TPA: GNAT family N-acetyltransferase [Prolixibacteraceae bacterium]|nr:GNAT family N-acetyltransferase [Prolixibacteraceae bacterium]